MVGGMTVELCDAAGWVGRSVDGDSGSGGGSGSREPGSSVTLIRATQSCHNLTSSSALRTSGPSASCLLRLASPLSSASPARLRASATASISAWRGKREQRPAGGSRAESVDNTNEPTAHNNSQQLTKCTQATRQCHRRWACECVLNVAAAPARMSSRSVDSAERASSRSRSSRAMTRHAASCWYSAWLSSWRT